MIKTIKVKKQLRLDELIKYVWDDDSSVRGFTVFRSDCDNFKVRVSTHMLDYVWDNTSKFSGVPRHATFTVEVEEEITDDTAFKNVVITFLDGINHMTSTKYYSIRSIRRDYPTVTEIHTLINGKLQLIWEAE